MRLIDADKVIDVMKAAYWDENIQSAKDDPCVIDAMIDWSIRQVKDAPTEDAAPVVHAHWIERQLSERGEFEFCCSKCEHTNYGYDNPGNYCPDCGAKMDEEVDDEKVYHRSNR